MNIFLVHKHVLILPYLINTFPFSHPLSRPFIMSQLNPQTSDTLQFQNANTLTVVGSRQQDLGAMITLDLFLSTMRPFPLAVLNRDGAISTFLAIPLYFTQPYVNSAGQTRIVWIVVNTNSNITVNPNTQQAVARNSTAGIAQMFLERSINGVKNPFNCLTLEDSTMRSILVPADPTDGTMQVKLETMFNAYKSAIDALLSKKQQLSEADYKKALNTTNEKYFGTLNQAVTEGKLINVTAFMIREKLSASLKIHPTSANANNPYMNWQVMGKTFNISHCPIVNTFTGVVTVNGNEAPEGTDLTIGRRALENSKLFETCRMATVTDGYGNTTQIMLRVQDLPYMQVAEENTRSVIFEDLTEDPKVLYISGTVGAYIAQQGSNAMTTGNNLYTVVVDRYEVANQKISNIMSAQMSTAVDGIGDLGDMDFGDILGVGNNVSSDAPIVSQEIFTQQSMARNHQNNEPSKSGDNGTNQPTQEADSSLV